MLSDALAQVFSANGPLAQSFSRYVPRSQQLGLAQAVEQAIEQHQVLVAEAGTGTGKTWAYLVPILLSEGKALISTGTRTLQDQLYHRDLPELCQGLQTSASAALLKGRSKDRKSTRLNSSHVSISYAVFCLKKKTTNLYIIEPDNE